MVIKFNTINAYESDCKSSEEISGWHSSINSFGGKIILVKRMLHSIPIIQWQLSSQNYFQVHKDSAEKKAQMKADNTE